jgi:hypothetical protein
MIPPRPSPLSTGTPDMVGGGSAGREWRGHPGKGNLRG